jgi:hypothetical protein
MIGTDSTYFFICCLLDIDHVARGIEFVSRMGVVEIGADLDTLDVEVASWAQWEDEVNDK